MRAAPRAARMRCMIPLLAAVSLLGPLAVVAIPVAASADRTYYVPVTKTWTIQGHGYGHGRGLSQYGAQGAALRGLPYSQILSFYYPGTRLAKAKGRVRVLISDDWSSDLQVRTQRGLRVRDLRDGSSWQLPKRAGISRWRMAAVPDGSTAVQFFNDAGWHRWRVPDGRGTLRSDGEFYARRALTLLVPGGGDVVGQRYRGALRSVRPYRGATVRDTVNVVSMDQYVQGVVALEMPSSWKQAALRSQAVAARTYAAWQRAQNPDRYYQICDTSSCQVYGGVGAEESSTNVAVQATAGRMLTYRGNPAFTQFSASSGGWTTAGGTPYLKAKRDRFDAFNANPHHDWRVRVSVAALERAHPEIGRLVNVRVTRRDGHGTWNGRVGQIVLEGSSGRASLTGDDFRWQFGLRSTWFTIKPTPIMARWRSMGGAKSILGSPRSGEFPVLSSGSAQKFQSGRMYWTRNTGARAVKGPILAAYRRWGGPASNLRWPVTGMLKAPDHGHKVRFVHGAIYSRPQSGAHVLHGHVLSRWSKAGAAQSWLGYPKTNVFQIKGGVRARFQAGAISWDRSSRDYSVTRF